MRAAHGRPLAAADEDRTAAESRAVREGAAALASAGCARRAKKGLSPIADCKARLRGYYLSFAGFSTYGGR
jgi:hypothetical protein